MPPIIVTFRRLGRRLFPTVAALLLGFWAGPVRAEDADCLACHGDSGLADDTGRSLFVDPVPYRTSIHPGSGLGCGDCHLDISEYPHPEAVAPVDCGICHDAAAAEHGESVHKNVAEAAACYDCHGKHDILRADDPRSRVFPTRQINTCCRCHLDPELMNKYLTGSTEKVGYFMESVHARGLLKAGLVVSATCSSCHGAHGIRDVKDPASLVYRTQIPNTCGHCHVGIYNDYIKGVHGKNYLDGNLDVPVCTDCHSEHSIQPPSDERSTVSAANVPGMCSRCHDAVALNDKYRIPARRLHTFRDTFHGIALRFGDTRVASCASCHGYHDIRPSSDPKSPIHPDNLAKTCGQCHPNAGENFAKGRVHVNRARESSLPAYLVQLFYTIFIVSLIGGFSLFIVVDLFGRWRRARGKKQ